MINNLEREDTLKLTVIGKEKKYLNTKAKLVVRSVKGMRLKDEALCVKVNKLNISEVTRFSIEDAQKWFDNLDKILTLRDKKIAQHILKEINERLNFLLNVGLNYLTLSRGI